MRFVTYVLRPHVRWGVVLRLLIHQVAAGVRRLEHVSPIIEQVGELTIFRVGDCAEENHDVHPMNADGDKAGITSATGRTGRHPRVPRPGGSPYKTPRRCWSASKPTAARGQTP